MSKIISFNREAKEKLKAGIPSSVGFLRLAILDILYGLVKGKRNFGCFAGTNGGVLMSSGEFYPCARFASKKIMKMDDQYNFKYYQEIFSPKYYDKCEPCNLKQVCNAGCTYSQVMNDNKPLDSVCELFHIYYECAMRVVEECRDEPVFQDLFLHYIESVGVLTSKEILQMAVKILKKQMNELHYKINPIQNHH